MQNIAAVDVDEVDEDKIDEVGGTLFGRPSFRRENSAVVTWYHRRSVVDHLAAADAAVCAF